MITCYITMDIVSDYFALMLCFFSISYIMCRTRDRKFVCLFRHCYSLNDAGRMRVLGGGICSAPYRIFYFILFYFILFISHMLLAL